MPAEGIYISVDIMPLESVEKVIISCADRGRLRISFHGFVLQKFVQIGHDVLIDQDEAGDWMTNKFGKSVFNWHLLAQAFSNQYVTEETE